MASKKEKIEKIKNIIPTGQLLHKTVEEVMSASMLPYSEYLTAYS